MKKKYVEILICYRWLFVKGDVIIGEWSIFGVEIFLCYSQFFIKGNLVIGRVECSYCSVRPVFNVKYLVLETINDSAFIQIPNVQDNAQISRQLMIVYFPKIQIAYMPFLYQILYASVLLIFLGKTFTVCAVSSDIFTMFL